jgi:hypothetical protein
MLDSRPVIGMVGGLTLALYLSSVGTGGIRHRGCGLYRPDIVVYREFVASYLQSGKIGKIVPLKLRFWRLWLWLLCLFLFHAIQRSITSQKKPVINNGRSCVETLLWASEAIDRNLGVFRASGQYEYSGITGGQK